MRRAFGAWRLVIGAALVLTCAGCQVMGPRRPVATARAAAATGSASGQMCGGIAGLHCGKGEYCRLEPGECRTVADAAGVCKPKPELCYQIYAPVCGCDGKTYSNDCVAAAAGVSIAANGACAKP